MGLMAFGLAVVIAGFMVALGSGSPGALVRSEVFGLATVAAGAVAVPVGMVAHVRQVNRVDRLSR